MELTDDQARKIVSLVCDGMHLSRRARVALDDKNSHACIAYYYRLDSEVLPSLVEQLPPQMQNAIEQTFSNEQPPGK